MCVTMQQIIKSKKVVNGLWHVWKISLLTFTKLIDLLLKTGHVLENKPITFYKGLLSKKVQKSFFGGKQVSPPQRCSHPSCTPSRCSSNDGYILHGSEVQMDVVEPCGWMLEAPWQS